MILVVDVFYNDEGAKVLQVFLKVGGVSIFIKHMK